MLVSNIGPAYDGAGKKIDGVAVVKFVFAAHSINVATHSSLKRTLFNWLLQW
jgi:hypothetical protein